MRNRGLYHVCLAELRLVIMRRACNNGAHEKTHHFCFGRGFIGFE